MKDHFDITEAKKVSILSYLQAYGFDPVKKETGEYLYLSPFRIEKTPSFRVREKMGTQGEDLWFDFGLGGKQGGDIISLVQKLHQIHSIDEVLKYLKAYKAGFIVGGVLTSAIYKKNSDENTWNPSIQILGDPKPLNHFILLKYLREERKIPNEISQKYLSLIYYQHSNSTNKKHYFGFGWLNESNAYEIRGAGRNPFKTVSGKKDLTIFRSKPKSGNIYIFEGMLDYLSALVLKNSETLNGTSLILNGASMISRVEASLKDVEIERINVFTDNDQAGQQAYLTLQKMYENTNIVKQNFYKGYKDVNEYLIAKRT